jgi:hypothetical protein
MYGSGATTSSSSNAGAVQVRCEVKLTCTVTEAGDSSVTPAKAG